MKKIKTLFAFIIITISCFAQKQTFDVLNYTMPKGWDKTEMSNGIQLSAKNDGKGNYATDNGGLIINNNLFWRLNKAFVPHH